ncbi:MAG TPA: hypothetical protein VJV03_08570 [Pyrinomonadaceae bacterium]|nr:hypothetical protein [Pyrinomonadaceae bacterium]
MSIEAPLEIPSELAYITDAGRAISVKRYREALSILKEGLRENSGMPERIDIEMFIALLRALVVEIEVRVSDRLT